MVSPAKVVPGPARTRSNSGTKVSASVTDGGAAFTETLSARYASRLPAAGVAIVTPAVVAPLIAVGAGKVVPTPSLSAWSALSKASGTAMDAPSVTVVAAVTTRILLPVTRLTESPPLADGSVPQTSAGFCGSVPSASPTSSEMRHACAGAPPVHVRVYTPST